MSDARLRRILAVEDEATDALILAEALKLCANAARCRLEVEPTVARALERMRAHAGGEGAPFDLVLCDLRLPIEDGFDLLRQLRGDERLRAAPVLIFTTSRSPEDVRRAYELGANAFLPKPEGIEELVRLLECLQEFWFGFARLPAQLD